MVFIGYDSKRAMAMTYIFLMGGSLASVIQNAAKRKKSGALVMDYNMILLNMPMASSGTIFGVSYGTRRPCSTSSSRSSPSPACL